MKLNIAEPLKTEHKRTEPSRINSTMPNRIKGNKIDENGIKVESLMVIYYNKQEYHKIELNRRAVLPLHKHSVIVQACCFARMEIQQNTTE